MKTGFLDKLIDRLDRLDPDNLQSHFLHLAKEKGFLETVFHTLQEGVIVLDGRGRIRFANRAAEQLIGLTDQDAKGETIRRFLGDIDWDRLLNLDAEEWSKTMAREIEVGYPKHRFLTLYGVPLAGAEGRGAVLILRDVTQERQKEASSLQSERLRAITLLAAGVAHEIGNPLNSLTIHLQLLRRELEALPEDARATVEELVAVASREVERLDGIIHQFLRAVRPVAPKLESASLRRVLDESIDFLKHEIADHKVLVEVEGESPLPPVRLDPAQIRQALFNVIKNAVESMPEGGVLRISLSSDDRMVSIGFQDTGAGIDSEVMNRIFDPYYTTKQGGSGLGMMIVQRVIRDHGGEIEIESEAGRGTRVTLFLPREDRLIRMLPARRPEPGEDGPGMENP
ncbi:MAG: ATP-binding protein [Kiritimatiellia bacterium]|nr:ATP-binding protein [Kiritimatiellia bacterium]